MLSPEAQSSLIHDINQSSGFRHEEFVSAAGIRGNFKIFLPEALRTAPRARKEIVAHMAGAVENAEALTAVGGAMELAAEVAFLTGQDLIRIQTLSSGGDKFYHLLPKDKEKVLEQPDVAVIEDVSSTNHTLLKALGSTGIIDLVSVGAVGWRRGISAPENWNDEEIESQNLNFPFKKLYEYPLSFNIVPVIERHIPLWIPKKQMIQSYLPELAEV